MIRNYVKIAFRALWRSKGHSIINILGLSLGIGCCVLISLYVYDEWTYDTFHSKAQRIFRVYGREDWGENQQFSSSNTPFPMGPTLKDNLPEVESQVRINKIGTQVRVGDQMFSETLNIVGQDFFRVFDFEIVRGEGPEVLSNASNIVLTDWAAKKYFGEEDPVGKVISVQLGENFEEFKVAAITRDLPSNSSITYSATLR